MKQIILIFLIISLVNAVCVSQNREIPLIKIKVKNSSLIPKRITIITYQPGDTGNGTEQVTMLPKSVKELAYKEGTKIYLADSKQVEIVMSGKRIDREKPFLTIKKEDNGKIFLY